MAHRFEIFIAAVEVALPVPTQFTSSSGLLRRPLFIGVGFILWERPAEVFFSISLLMQFLVGSQTLL